MLNEFVNHLIINASLLLIISIIYNALATQATSKRYHQFIQGMVLGGVGILLIMNTVTLSNGVIFDTRSILISVSGFFFGVIPTVIGMALISAYRLFLGGDGAITGVLVTCLSGFLGILWNRFRLPEILKNNKLVWLEFYIFGICVHLGMLLCMLTLPGEKGLQTLREIAAPIMIVYPVVSLLLCTLLYAGIKNTETRRTLTDSEQRFRTLVEEAPIGITISRGHVMYFVNAKYEEILGRSKEEIMRLGWQGITHPDDLEQDILNLEELIAGRSRSYTMVKRYLSPKGDVIWVKMVVAAISVNKNEEFHNLCMVQDISELVEANQYLKNSESRYKRLYLEYQNKQALLTALLNSIDDLIFYKDTEGVYMGCNEAFERFLDKTQGEIIGSTDHDLLPSEVAAEIRNMDARMMDRNQAHKNEEYMPRGDGSYVWLETLKTPIYDAKGNRLGLIGVSRDITDRKQKEEEILYLNYHDILTGLHNRTFFEEEKHRLDIPDNLPLSVIIGDLNGLKLINDAFGHAEGDRLLTNTARILTSCLRKGDLLARTGGDEFTILLPCTDGETTKRIVASIKIACQQIEKEENREIYYTSISLGYDTKTLESESLEMVTMSAEESMYRAKLLESKSMHSTIINSIKTTLFEKSSETEKHASRLGQLALQLGNRVGISEKEQIALELVSTLHDIGKIGIDKHILNKPGKLTDQEWHEMKKHPEIGYRIAQTVPELRPIADLVLCHHERWDGKGYPQGLREEEIPYLARILSVVDAYDAMTEDRPYRKAMGKEAAINEIRSHAGTQFDPVLAEVFITKVLEEEQ